MATIADVRQELADIVSGIGLRCSPYLSDQINPPCAMVDIGEMDPRLVFSNATQEYRFVVRVFVARANERAAQMLLDDYRAMTGSTSIVATINDGDSWTSGLVHYAQVIRVSDTVAAAFQSGGEYLVVDFDIEVVW